MSIFTRELVIKYTGHRCWQCSRFYAVEETAMRYNCPFCAVEESERRYAEVFALKRSIAALRGHLKRGRK